MDSENPVNFDYIQKDLESSDGSGSATMPRRRRAPFGVHPVDVVRDSTALGPGRGEVVHGHRARARPLRQDLCVTNRTGQPIARLARRASRRA